MKLMFTVKIGHSVVAQFQGFKRPEEIISEAESAE